MMNVVPALNLLLAITCQGNDPSCIVPVKVGSAKLKMIVDTGADVTMMTLAAAKKARIRIDSDVPIIVVQGVNSASSALLVRSEVEVDKQKEKDVLLIISPEYKSREADGLLGMSFLERFRYNMGGGKLELTPIDKDDKPKRGGHGKSWWKLRFKKNTDRLRLYERVLPHARKRDSQVVGYIPGELTESDRIERLRKFSEKMLDELRIEAARYGVPHEWRK